MPLNLVNRLKNHDEPPQRDQPDVWEGREQSEDRQPGPFRGVYGVLPSKPKFGSNLCLEVCNSKEHNRQADSL